MSEARAAILARIREATRDVPADEPAAWTGAGAPARADGATAELLDLLEERINDYGATFTRVGGDEEAAAEAVAAALARHGARRIAVPADLAPALCPAGVELHRDDPPLAHAALTGLDGVLTECVLAIAQTGTLVLDAGAGQGRRVLTLLPDLHVCVVRAEQVVSDVPEAIAALIETRRPLTFVSGPSATSDIELERVEGVHGPRRLEVVLLAPSV